VPALDQPARSGTHQEEVDMADAGRGIGTQREGRQQRTRQAKQPGAKAKGGKKASKSKAANKAVHRLGKTGKHTSG
jgi:hypothetical protein